VKAVVDEEEKRERGEVDKTSQETGWWFR